MTSKITNWQDAQIQLMLSVETKADFFAALSGIARDLGFDYCAYGMRMSLPFSNPKVFMHNNYPADWQERYTKENYLAIDPTVAHGMKSVVPLIWSDQVFSSSRPFWEEARSHGLRVGWAQSSYNAKGVGGLLTLARSGDDLLTSELKHNFLKMTWLTQVAHEGLSRLIAEPRPSDAQIDLTPREIEVLKWSADGKTSSEVAEIMNVSERTVNFHVNNTLLKLCASNKLAAVIKAAMLRLI